jgi:hypothetical protein
LHSAATYNIGIKKMRTATLIEPYNGYRNVEVISKEGNKWLCSICGSGKEIYLYEDEFVYD